MTVNFAGGRVDHDLAIHQRDDAIGHLIELIEFVVDDENANSAVARPIDRLSSVQTAVRRSRPSQAFCATVRFGSNDSS